MKKQIEMTAEEVYKLNRKKAKVFKILAPIVFWSFLALTIVFFCFAIRNSIGNIIDINNQLSVDSEAERMANYNALIEKWGTWYVVGGTDSTLTISFVNIPNALFSGLMKMYSSLTMFCLIIAIMIGKVLFPAVAKSYTDNNGQLVDLTTLRSAEKITKMAGLPEEKITVKAKKKKSKKNKADIGW